MTRPPAGSLAAYLLALADDELILAHRNSEWTGHGPILEEDIAFTNIALDEMGHAGLWYAEAAPTLGRTADELVFFRAAPDFRCVQLVELPKGDWAFSMLRQYLFDAAEAVRLPLLAESAHAPLAAIAAKIRTEEIYHYRHTAAWVRRLGLGTEESHRRLQSALDSLWAYALQLFSPLPGEPELAAAGLVPEAGRLREAWEALVLPLLAEAGLGVSTAASPPAVTRSAHTEHLPALLEEMQSVARTEAPGADW